MTIEPYALGAQSPPTLQAPQAARAEALDSWGVVGAGVVGRDHRAVGRGGQDAWAGGARGELAWGVVSDGCGSGARSEVGAALTVAHLGGALPRLLASEMPLDDLPARAIGALVDALEGVRAAVVAGDDASTCFVHAHLLATVVAFAIRRDEGVVFWQGDGVLVVDDELVVLDEDDRPAYPAYSIATGRRSAPIGLRRFDARAATRVAVATDGFDARVLPDVFGRSAVALGRFLNVRARQGDFADDATVVAAVRGRLAAFESKATARGGGPAP